MSTYLGDPNTSGDHFEPKDHLEPKWLSEKELDDSTFLHSFNYETTTQQPHTNVDVDTNGHFEVEDDSYTRGNQGDLGE